MWFETNLILFFLRHIVLAHIFGKFLALDDTTPQLVVRLTPLDIYIK